MSTQTEFLQRLISLMEEAGIPYMIAGSLGSSFHGEPRTTNDVDLIIDPDKKQLDSFIRSLGDDYYINPETAQDAFNRGLMFNVIDNHTGWKAGLIIRKKRPFSIGEFQRRRQVSINGLDIWMLSPEDVILSKLEWSRGQQPGRQFRDAVGVAIVKWDNLNWEYMKKWACELQVDDLLKQLIEKAAELMQPPKVRKT
jgi:hypothetical protein